MKFGITLINNDVSTRDYKCVVTRSKIEQLFRSATNKLSFTIDGAYLSENGKINVALSDINYHNIFQYGYDYNYMWITQVTDVNDQHFTNIQRYAFVDKIEVYNDIAVISYTLDIWTTFYPYTNIKNAEIERIYPRQSLYADAVFSIDKDFLPKNNCYFGNLKTPSNKIYAVLAQIQVYKLDTDGKKHGRDVRMMIGKPVNGSYNLSYDEAIELIQSLIKYQGNKVYIGRDNPDVYYEVIKTYIIPYFDLSNYINISYDLSLTGSEWCGINSFFNIEIYNKIITNDGQILSVGTLKHQIDAQGVTNLNLSVKLSCDKLSISMIMYFVTTVTDITNDFEYEMPYQSVTAESLATARTARELAINKSYISAIQAAGRGLISPISGIAGVLNAYEALDYEYKKTYSGTFSVETGNNNLVLIEQFVTLNAIPSIDINEGLKQEGYITKIYINESTLPQFFNSTDNYLKFKKCNVTGRFDATKAQAIKNILIKGTQIINYVEST